LEDRTLLSASLQFDPDANSLSILGDAADTTIRQSFTSAGFLEVAVDGQTHSSDPASAAFDQTLAGVSAAALTGIHLDSGVGHDTLILAWDGFANRPTGSLTVSAANADVNTEYLTLAGCLTIQAQRISVEGPVHASAITLAGSAWVTVEAKGIIAGDQIDVSAGVFVNSGQLHADDLAGGQISISATNLMNAGQISADGNNAGGTVKIAFTDSYVDTSAAVTSASAGLNEPRVMAGRVASAPGFLTIDGGATGHLFTSGTFLAKGSTGGSVDLFARDVVLDAATVDVSGDSGGGSIRIGGNGTVGQVANLPAGQSNHDNVRHANAQTLTVTTATALRADALRAGPGGRVIVWSDQDTHFDGSVSARGGPTGGDGGFIEISGAANLEYGGMADTGAPAGKAGTMLLDPKNLVIDAAAGVMPQFNFVDPHPTTGAFFGQFVNVLNSGNVVVGNPNDNFGGTNAGAVYLFDGLTGALLSSLVGSSANDRVGALDTFGTSGVTRLTNGNYTIGSLLWNGNRGAVTWASGITGVSGTVSESNSLVGSSADDRVGFSVTALSNGNYVVRSLYWDGNRGAATWGRGTTGVSGAVSASNSLVGSFGIDEVGLRVTALSNGNYVVSSLYWNGNRGEATWGSGTTGVSGIVSESNSLVGSSGYDYVGNSVTALSNGNYVVSSYDWNGYRGEATWGSGTTGVSGTVSASNSLVGSSPQDVVGTSVTALSNGNYVVGSSGWNGSRGAATWASGTTGVSGTVSASNSLVGSSPQDAVGASVTPLTNGNYVVRSGLWNGSRGAATWCSGTTGVSGSVSESNSLVGSNANDFVGNSVTALSNGNYVVSSPYWSGNRGEATWGSGITGVSGVVSGSNSLVGSSASDRVGNSVTALGNGNYVVTSPYWSGNRGEATWGSGTTGVSGGISESDSLVGSSADDQVGYSVTALSNGNYVVSTTSWNGNRGAVTWGSGTAGVSGAVSESNSLIGSNANDRVGIYVTALTNGNYVVSSSGWNGSRGAATWGNGITGVSGVVSESNSLVGSSAYDYVGYPGVTPLSDGNYVVQSALWNGNRGAVTWGSGASGQTRDGAGVITPQNSIVGVAPNVGIMPVVDDPLHQAFVTSFYKDGSRRVVSAFALPNQLTYARGQAQTVTITPALLTHTLNGGTAVVLQASNDITIEDPILVDAGGQGGALTLQAGRSILINANITTDKGALTLIANDTVANGVVDAQRDPGSAFITMAGGTVLDTGTGPLDIELRDGAGLTNNSSRAINLQAITAGSITILNNGPSAGSDIRLETVATNGPQSYSSPHGITTVAGYLVASGSPITFTDSVAVNAGVTVGIDGDTVDFAGGGTQTLQTASGSQFSNVTHTGSGALRLTGGLNVGSFIESAGTFDANDQTVTVSGQAQITDGVYLAGTAPQNFVGGLLLTRGLFTSSTGPMTVTGPIAVLGGVLNGQGALESVTAIGGTLAPSPGILSVAGSVTLFTSTTFSVTLNGTDPGSYSQVNASGPVILSGSTLDLTLGFAPQVGDAFTLLSSASGPIIGTFAGLDEGATFMQDDMLFQITYQGGPDGHSVVLTRLS
jgi:hypothetical protein